MVSAARSAARPVRGVLHPAVKASNIPIVNSRRQKNGQHRTCGLPLKQNSIGVLRLAQLVEMAWDVFVRWSAANVAKNKMPRHCGDSAPGHLDRSRLRRPIRCRPSGPLANQRRTWSGPGRDTRHLQSGRYLRHESAGRCASKRMHPCWRHDPSICPYFRNFPSGPIGVLRFSSARYAANVPSG